MAGGPVETGKGGGRAALRIAPGKRGAGRRIAGRVVVESEADRWPRDVRAKDRFDGGGIVGMAGDAGLDHGRRGMTGKRASIAAHSRFRPRAKRARIDGPIVGNDTQAPAQRRR
ncbi:hypothetical protein [Burkholderia sp. MSMB1072]|uniref:hypothetical protein n=1 Tax=Burkholderia sp. MSMB1072 TaxID=1637871 RepID=UPI0012E3BAB0|nr:hypothetical protein [Burkholderia sp. MSMB1072]